MKHEPNPVVNIFVTNLVVLSRETKCNDKPAGAGSLRNVLIGGLFSQLPFLVNELHNLLNYLNIS